MLLAYFLGQLIYDADDVNGTFSAMRGHSLARNMYGYNCRIDTNQFPPKAIAQGDNSVPYASRDAWWRKRAGFVNHHVWITPFREEEKHAGGDYPNQSQGGDGLIKWTEQDRPIADTDIVLWYTFGHTHLPRPEDYPVMPTAYIGFVLKPSGFFIANPANDVPPAPKKIAVSQGCCH